MPTTSIHPRRSVCPARLTSNATLLVCKSCTNGRDLRRDLKSAITATGRKRELRIVACACLNLCPKRGSAAILVRSDRAARCFIIDARTRVDDALVSALLDERAGDSVSD